MPYFPEKQILFIHIPKNAGKSVEVALGLENRSHLNELGRRSLLNRAFTLIQRATSNPIPRRKLHGTVDITLCAQHLTLQEIQLLNLIPGIGTQAIRTFAVFRNPWSRAVSTYKHFSRNEELSPLGFEQFCLTWYDQNDFDHNSIAHRRQQIDYILDCRGRIATDRILRFEALEKDFYEMCNEWGMCCPQLEHVGKQSDNEEWKDLYTRRAMEIINERFADDIDYFNKAIKT